MASYTIQFQKGRSLRAFLTDYGTEQQCFQAVCKARWPDGFSCPDCGSKRHCRISRGHLFQCQDCHKQTSAMAGTIFQGTKLPLTVWFQAMHLLTQGKRCVSALELKRQLGVHYETAWSMKHKIMQVMAEREEATLPRLRDLCPTVPVLLATGWADQEALDLVAAHPFVTLLSKPFSFEERRGHLHQVAVCVPTVHGA